jgi:hypothetical protein
MGERRRSVRNRSFLRGCLYFNKRRGSLDCLIRDLSDSGARIIFSDSVSVPDVVELYIPQKERTVRARVQWRHGYEIGLDFPGSARTQESPPAPPSGDLVQRVTQLEAEIASLQRMVKRLRRDAKAGGNEDAA